MGEVEWILLYVFLVIRDINLPRVRDGRSGVFLFYIFLSFSRITFSCYFWRFLGLGELGSFVFWLLISIVVCIRFFLCQSALLCFLGLISLFSLVSLFYFIPCGFFVSCRDLFTTNTLLDNRLLGFLSSLRLRTAVRHFLQVSYMYFFRLSNTICAVYPHAYISYRVM